VKHPKKLRLIADTILTFAARPAPNVRRCDTTSLTTRRETGGN
jgi:hypothetical protein